VRQAPFVAFLPKEKTENKNQFTNEPQQPFLFKALVSNEDNAKPPSQATQNQNDKLHNYRHEDKGDHQKDKQA
jgi:hypothetical protein